MRPPDTEAQEAAAWAAFLQRLATHLEAQWPAMKERLGERLPAFVELAAQQTLDRGFTRAASVARLANLWFVWGPAFHDKPGFEWAAGLLAAPREREWATVHQLVQRSLLELKRLPDARIEPATLAAADQRLVDTFGRLGRHGELNPRQPPPLPLKACDLEAAEIRLLDAAVTQHYVFAAGQWQRAAFSAPASVRVEAARSMPRLVAVLAHAPGIKPQTRVQLRTRSHAVCDGDVHPALHFAGTHGLWRWAGHETRAVSWPVATLVQPPAAAGPGTAVAEETSPDIFKLDVQVCGLRDEGDALGSMGTQLWAWPAAQWLVTVERKAAEAQPVLAGRAPALRGSTRCGVECDGQAQDALPLRRAFEQGLDEATAAALQALLGLAASAPGLADVRLDGSLGLLLGRAALTWGWQLGAAGMAGRAYMRVLGALEMQACRSDLHIESELSIGEGRARLRLHCQAEAALALQLRRETAEPPLAAALMPAKAVFRLPITAEVTPLATDSGALLQAAGPCTGALVGEAGLRPRLAGGSGWEWYAQLRLEAAVLPLTLADPMLGVQRLSHPLWGAQVLIDWSVG